MEHLLRNWSGLGRGEQCHGRGYRDGVYGVEMVYCMAWHTTKANQPIPMIYIKVYMYQLFQCLPYIHARQVCLRDIKPQNMVVDPEVTVLKLHDFGRCAETRRKSILEKKSCPEE
ncbi:glycogen synthase kinase-3 alpha-like isoform X2 [Narcine bancroftii]|uniref:glycogen synthase kinase-3 alpha-like isoform X2 n=1 Tax=Narcine bancroftii TaxID=1343680 RepID=UPI003832009D